MTIEEIRKYAKEKEINMYYIKIKTDKEEGWYTGISFEITQNIKDAHKFLRKEFASIIAKELTGKHVFSTETIDVKATVEKK